MRKYHSRVLALQGGVGKGTQTAAIFRMIVAHPARLQTGSTLAETLVAVTLVGAFFVTIFEVNAVCLRYIDASKECVAAVQGVQDRIEGLRNLAFGDLISAGYMMNSQPTPAPSGPRPITLVYPSNSSDLAARATEEVTVSGLPKWHPSSSRHSQYHLHPPAGRCCLSERLARHATGLQRNYHGQGKGEIYLDGDFWRSPAQRRD